MEEPWTGVPGASASFTETPGEYPMPESHVHCRMRVGAADSGTCARPQKKEARRPSHEARDGRRGESNRNYALAAEMDSIMLTSGRNRAMNSTTTMKPKTTVKIG